MPRIIKCLRRVQVPRPQQFSRPLGGAGPMATIRAGPSNTAATSPPSRASGPSKGGRRNAKDLRRKVEQAREWYREKGASQNSSVGSAEDRASGRADRPSRRLRVFSVIKLRGTNVNRTQLLVSCIVRPDNPPELTTVEKRRALDEQSHGYGHVQRHHRRHTGR